MKEPKKRGRYYEMEDLLAGVRLGWYPKTAGQWRRFWLTYVTLLLHENGLVGRPGA